MDCEKRPFRLLYATGMRELHEKCSASKNKNNKQQTISIKHDEFKLIASYLNVIQTKLWSVCFFEKLPSNIEKPWKSPIWYIKKILTVRDSIDV